MCLVIVFGTLHPPLRIFYELTVMFLQRVAALIPALPDGYMK